MKRELLIAMVFLCVTLFAGLIAADHYDRAIVNSEKWTDVYSAVHYANLHGAQSSFLVSPSHGSIVLNEINSEEVIQSLNSEDRPYAIDYPSLIESRGFELNQEISGTNLNIELIRELEDITNFIVVGDNFGYNSLAVAPYAVQTKAWVFLANAENIFEIDSVLSGRDIDSLIVYGFTDPEVSEVLAKYSPETINTGDRFNDNIEIVERYLQIKPMQQTILTNGEFIEKEIMSGAEPVLFTGKDNVPEQIKDWLIESPISTGVLIGNDLVGAATNIRQSTGISVLVKFARNARSQAGGIAAVEALDLFPVPSPSMSLLIESANYNTALSQLEVTYYSESNIPVYARGTVTVNNGGSTERVGDLDPLFISPGDYKTVSYPLEINPQNQITAEISTLYGETPDSLEKLLRETVDINVVSVIDSCKINEENIKSVTYNKQEKSIFVKIKNTLDTSCWFDAEIRELKIGTSKINLGYEGSKEIPSGKTSKLRIEQELTDSDLEKNPRVNLWVYSGERQNNLVNIFSSSYELEIENFTVLTYAIALIVIIILGLIFYLFILKKKRKKYY